MVSCLGMKSDDHEYNPGKAYSISGSEHRLNISKRNRLWGGLCMCRLPYMGNEPFLLEGAGGSAGARVSKGFKSDSGLTLLSGASAEESDRDRCCRLYAEPSKR